MRYLLLFLAFSLQAQDWRPTDGRMANWIIGQTVGVIGGIPTNRTQWCDATVSIPGFGGSPLSTASADNSAALQYAWDNCPSNQFVYIGVPGTYRIQTAISQKAGSLDPENNQITIRGHPSGVTINFDPPGVSSSKMWTVGNTRWKNNSWTNASNGEFATSNLLRGDYVYTFATTPATYEIINGTILWIEAENDGTYVTANGNGFPVTANTAYDRQSLGLRNRVHPCQVTNIVGNAVYFTPPVPEAFTTARNTWLSGACARKSDGTILGVGIGFENLTFVMNTNLASSFMFNVQSMVGCWFKNCTMSNLFYAGVLGQTMVNCQFQTCYIGPSEVATVGRGYGLDLRATGGIVVENSIIDRMYIPIITGCSSMNVYAHNFIIDTLTQGGLGTQGGWININHGPHNMYHLVEGNIGGRVHADFNQGSGYKFTVYRHADWTNDTKSTVNRSAIRFDRSALSNTVAASYLGNPNLSWDYKNTNDSYSTTINNTYQLGFPAIGSNNYDDSAATGTTTDDWDPAVFSSVIIHGNYTVAQGTIEWQASNPFRHFEPSLYYTNVPSWWDTTKCPWPGVGSDLPAGAHPWNPAKLRFYGLTTHPQLSLWQTGVDSNLRPIP